MIGIACCGYLLVVHTRLTRRLVRVYLDRRSDLNTHAHSCSLRFDAISICIHGCIPSPLLLEIHSFPLCPDRWFFLRGATSWCHCTMLPIECVREQKVDCFVLLRNGAPEKTNVPALGDIEVEEAQSTEVCSRVCVSRKGRERKQTNKQQQEVGSIFNP